MPRATLPSNEFARLNAVRASGVLDTAPDADIDALTAIAAEVCGVPIAAVSLIDQERQWFKAKVGLCISETPRDQAFCAHAILNEEPLVIRDATEDERTRDNVLVTGDPQIRFYAGAPLRDSDGFALGTLCVIDTKPRDLTSKQLQTLKHLARQVEARFELARQLRSNSRRESAISGTRHGITWPTILSLTIGLAITAVVVHFSNIAHQEATTQRFARLHDGVIAEITRRVNLPIYGLRGARGVYAASASVERHEFSAYVASRDLSREFPGVQAMGFIKHVARENLSTFVVAERRDDAPGFSVRSPVLPSAAADDLYVIKFIEPTESNRPGSGLDVGSEPAIRAALERASELGETTITAPMSLAGLGFDGRGYLYVIPVYRNKTQPLTPHERKEALDGLLFASASVDEIFAGVADASDGMLDLFVSDDQAASGPLSLYATRETKPGGEAGAVCFGGRLYGLRSTLPIGGRSWTLRTAANARFAATTSPTMSIVAGVCGSLLSVLLAATVWSLGRSRTRAFALARNMTADLNDAKSRAERTANELRTQSGILRTQSERLFRTNHLAHVGGWELDLVTNAVTWTDEVYRIHEISVGTKISVSEALSYYTPDSRAQVQAAINNAIADGGGWDLELQMLTAKNRAIWVRTQGECLKHDNVAHKLCGAFQDITDRKTAEIQLRSAATCDKLTGLPNRSLLTDRLHQCQNRYARDSSRAFAVLFLDFDRFKHTNDTLGHDAGDELLKQIATRLRNGLGPNQPANSAAHRATAGRLGGDEFVVVVDEIDALQDATGLADHLLNVLAEPYSIFGHQVCSTASIGVVISSPSCVNPDDLLRNADTAMYEAKLAGKGRYVVFDAAMELRAQGRLKTEADLRLALVNGELSLAFQPVISLENRQAVGAETLLRWQSPTRGMIPPAEWIPLAEETGLILPIGDWVLQQACEQFMNWSRTLGAKSPQSISVNMSRKQLMAADMIDRVHSILAHCGMPPECLHLEVCEDVMMKDPSVVCEVLWKLRKSGIKIDMDDFGMGNSSLAVLHKFPIDVLKIDRSFIKNLGHGREFIAVVQAIVQLAHNLGIVVVAEGIETEDQLVILQTIDCTFGQGHLLGVPMDNQSFVAAMTDGISASEFTSLARCPAA